MDKRDEPKWCKSGHGHSTHLEATCCDQDAEVRTLRARNGVLEMVLACHAIDHYNGKVEHHHPICERAVLEWRENLRDETVPDKKED